VHENDIATTRAGDTIPANTNWQQLKASSRSLVVHSRQAGWQDILWAYLVTKCSGNSAGHVSGHMSVGYLGNNQKFNVTGTKCCPLSLVWFAQ